MADEEPELADIPVTAVLFALSDPTRLDMIIELRGLGETPCGTLRSDLPKATRSHHLKVLREAGLTRQRREGTAKFLRLREDELAQRFPGLLDTVIADAAARPIR